MAGRRFAAVFRFAVFRRAGFRAAVFRLAVDFRFAEDFRAGLRAAVFRFAEDFLRAGFLAVRFFAAIPFPLPLYPVDLLGADSCGGAYDAIRFRRRRSRSLIPPQTPYRSSRRSA